MIVLLNAVNHTFEVGDLKWYLTTEQWADWHDTLLKLWHAGRANIGFFQGGVSFEVKA